MKYETIPKSYVEYPDSIMSNCDHEIENEVVDILKREKRWASYPGWNFWGGVWWNRKRKKWACMVKCYREHVNTIYADSPEELMKEVSDEYGYD